MSETAPPLAFGRSAPKPLLKAGRAFRRWRALGPRLGKYQPVSTLELPATAVRRARVPAVNFHAHLGRWLSNDGSWIEKDVDALLDMMSGCNIESTVNLDGRWGGELEANLDRYDRAHPGRFYTFCQLDWRDLERPDGPERLVRSLRQSVAAGARGLKVWKDLGLSVEAKREKVMPDDPRLRQVWDAAGDLGIPVLIHVADPVAFFQPVDRHNERLEELLRHPGNSRCEGGLRLFHRLVMALENILAAHPRTTIVGAHAVYPENLGYLAGMFEHHPNFFIDVAWAHHQLGRQPRAAAALLARYPDRVLFGSDVFPLRRGILETYFRFLETEDEAFPYTDAHSSGSGRWCISGLGLAPEVLDLVYAGNARRLLRIKPSVQRGKPVLVDG